MKAQMEGAKSVLAWPECKPQEGTKASEDIWSGSKKGQNEEQKSNNSLKASKHANELTNDLLVEQQFLPCSVTIIIISVAFCYLMFQIFIFDHELVDIEASFLKLNIVNRWKIVRPP